MEMTIVVGLILAIFVAWLFDRVLGGSIQAASREARVQDAAFGRTVEFFEEEMPVWYMAVDLWFQHWAETSENLGCEHFKIQAQQELGL